MSARLNIFHTAAAGLRSREGGRGTLADGASCAGNTKPNHVGATTRQQGSAYPHRATAGSPGRNIYVKNQPFPNPQSRSDSSWGWGKGPDDHAQGAPAGTTARPSRRTALRRHHLRGSVAAATIAVVSGLFLAATPQAFALSKNVYTISFAGPSAVPLTNPTALAVDNSTGDLYVSNTPLNEQQTIVVDATGGTYTLTFKGQTTGPILFDASPNQVRENLAQLSTIQTVGGVRVSGADSGHGGTYTVEFSSDHSQPQIAADPSHLTGGASTVIIATIRPSADVEKFTPSGEFILIFGGEVNKGKVEEAEHGQPVTEAQQNVCDAGEQCQPGSLGTSPGSFTDPESLAVDNSLGGEGDVYVGDRGAATGENYIGENVQKFGPQGNLITAWAKGGFLDGSEDPDGFSFAGSGIFGGLTGVAVDPVGNLFVSSETRFFEFAPDGAFLTDFTPNIQGVEGVEANYGRFTAGLAVDAAGDLYADERGSVLKLNSSGVLLAPIVGGGANFALDPTTRDVFATVGREVDHYAPFCHYGHLKPEACSPIDSFGAAHLSEPRGLALNDSSGTVYVADAGQRDVAVFDATPFLPDVIASAKAKAPTEESVEGEVNPAGAPEEITSCEFTYGKEENSYGEGSAACQPSASFSGTAHPTASFTGLTYGTTYHYRLGAEDSNGLAASYDQSFTTLPQEPAIEAQHAVAVHSDFALIAARVNPGGGEAEYHTHYHVEYVTQKQFEEGEFQGAQQSPSVDLGSARTFQAVSVKLPGLTPNTSYRYRLVAENASSPPGGNLGPTHAFTTLPFHEVKDTCLNAHVRQQTSASLLLDCRAYELVSAPNTSGYDVESNLIAGQSPFGDYPEAHGRLVYGIHDGGIPGTGEPTNRGVDPYIATRTEEGWKTEYVGIPAHGTPSTAPFSSTLLQADAGLHTFAFGGPEICKPCFGAGQTETGEPLHLPNGKLVQGMEGSIPQPGAEPAGYVARPLSADGTHLVFGSKSQFEPGGDSNGEVSIYDRNLSTGETHVVSKLPDEANIPCLAANCASSSGGIGELAISKEGSHVLIGQLTEEAAGAKYWHLYINVGDSPRTIELTPGAATGVLFDGMTADGSKVFFSSEEHLTEEDEQHSGADLYMWSQKGEEAGEPLTLISKGNGHTCDPAANSAHKHWNAGATIENCGVVAIGGGGGVASGDGTVYFLSPELLAGTEEPTDGTVNAPNLYVARPGDGYAPHFVASLESALTGPHPPDQHRTFLRDFGTFTKATALAVEHTTGDLYVLDAGADTVQKFDSAGNPVDFTAGTGTTANQLSGAETKAGSFSESLFGIAFPTQLAVDPANGDFYVPDIEHGAIDKFKPNGELEKSFGAEGQVEVGDPSAVAVDPATGEIYVSGLFGGVSVFSSSGTPGPVLPVEGFLISVAVDSSGAVYTTQFGGATNAYTPTGEFEHELAGSNPSQSVGVDPANNDVYVDEGSQIARFDSSGHPLGTLGSGQLSGSVGIAIDPEGDLYATDAGGTKVAAYGPLELAPSPLTDNPLVLDSVTEPETRHTADFQTTPDGHFAAFPSTLALAGREEETAGHTEAYRYDASAGALACASCTPTGIPSASEASLAQDGQSLANDGAVFFNTSDQLAAADTDEKQDAYEWEPKGTGNCTEESPTYSDFSGACTALISSGTSTFSSALLGISSDGTDAFFFTRDSLVPQDENGPTVKVYDARVQGGFPYTPPRADCKASDECHGASSPPPPPLQVGSESSTPGIGNHEVEKCKKGFVKKHGKCIKKPKHHRHHKRAHHKRGGHK